MSDDELKIYPAWRRVEAELMSGGLSDGEIIAMDYLRKSFGLKDPREATSGHEALQQQMAFNFIIGELKASMLENHSILLRIVEGVGYMAVAPGDQTRLTMKDRGSEVLNALVKANREVSYIRDEALTDEQRRENIDARVRLGHIMSMAKKKLSIDTAQDGPKLLPGGEP
jgi:hypothetical protein